MPAIQIPGMTTQPSTTGASTGTLPPPASSVPILPAPLLPTAPGPLIPAQHDIIPPDILETSPVPSISQETTSSSEYLATLAFTNVRGVHPPVFNSNTSNATTIRRNTAIALETPLLYTTAGTFSTYVANITTSPSSGANISTVATVSSTYDAPGTLLTALPSAHIHYLTSPLTTGTTSTTSAPLYATRIAHLQVSIPTAIAAFLSLQAPTPTPMVINATLTTTATSASESILANAMFSRTAVITWLSLFFSFMFFALLVFGLQKVMRRIRARRWLAAREREWEDKAKVLRARWGRDWRPVGIDGVCEFMDGNDMAVADSGDGVNSRNGSWSRRRDGRQWVRRGGRR
ncbi:hypothetical protein ABW21_db0203506 [Orbilia brochopaga]|nr:hypothetical protein ABW21_db0203506 [Drechslerella brochopaga]